MDYKIEDFEKYEYSEPIEMSELLSEYQNKWVVLSFDETKVLSSSDKLSDLKDYLDKGIFMKVPNINEILIP
ncbi:MAG TPA: hypothetical protein PLG90_01305 [Ignavibacteria bacterium]|nr:hypothetical protein [Ignavibacteria bacterium]